MSARGIANFFAGIGLFAMAFGFLIGMIILITAVPANAFARSTIIVLFGNLAVAATFAALYVLDAPSKRRVSSVRMLTPVGWCLMAFTANLMAGVAMIPSAPLPLRMSPRILGVLVGLPTFLVGWFLLSRFGFRVWRKTEPCDTTEPPKARSDDGKSSSAAL